MGFLLTIYMAESCFGKLEITNGQSTCEEREGVKTYERDLSEGYIRLYIPYRSGTDCVG